MGKLLPTTLPETPRLCLLATKDYKAPGTFTTLIQLQQNTVPPQLMQYQHLQVSHTFREQFGTLSLPPSPN